jgi:hypothetical protein
VKFEASIVIRRVKCLVVLFAVGCASVDRPRTPALETSWSAPVEFVALGPKSVSDVTNVSIVIVRGPGVDASWPTAEGWRVLAVRVDPGAAKSLQTFIVDKRERREALGFASSTLSNQTVDLLCAIKRSAPSAVEWCRVTRSGFTRLERASIPDRAMRGGAGVTLDQFDSHVALIRIGDDYVASMRNFSWNGPDQHLFDFSLVSKEAQDEMRRRHEFDVRLLGAAEDETWDLPFLEWWIVASP